MLLQLKRAIRRRDVPAASTFLKRHTREVGGLRPGVPGHAGALDQLARWTDFDTSYIAVVKKLLPSFQKKASAMTLVDAAHVANSAGLIALHAGDFTEAIREFEFAALVGDRVKDPDLQTTSKYCIARAHWKRSEYREALRLNAQALQAAEHLANPPSTAVIWMLDAWLHFLMGEHERAVERLQNAATILNKTKDFINHGNIKSFEARLARRRGDYESALTFLNDAIIAYSKADPNHRNVARSHVNMAFLKRLRALDGAADAADLRAEAFRHLDDAARLYANSASGRARGLGKVHCTRALLQFDEGRKTTALEEAGKAYDIGFAASDQLIMADAQTIQAKILWSVPGEEEGQRAHHLAAAAVTYAEATDNKRAVARAHLHLGLAYLHEPFFDPDMANRHFDVAHEQLITGESDYLRSEIRSARALAATYSRDAGVVVRLTRGELAGTLQQILVPIANRIIFAVHTMEQSVGANGSQRRTASRLKIGKARIKEALSHRRAQ
jgi:tetratricopeptide (TPR) repeat protein